jgi:hypothetical protein
MISYRVCTDKFKIRSTSEVSMAIYSVYQNDWSGLEVDYIHKCGEQNYKY